MVGIGRGTFAQPRPVHVLSISSDVFALLMEEIHDAIVVHRHRLLLLLLLLLLEDLSLRDLAWLHGCLSLGPLRLRQLCLERGNNKEAVIR